MATRARGARAGERVAREAGSSIDYLDDRPYQPGDDLRMVDWRAYARTRRLRTRLFHAERATELHVLLDVSPSMRLFGKDRFAAAVARVLIAVGRHEAAATVHLSDGRSGPPVRRRSDLPLALRFLETAFDAPAEPGATEEGDALVERLAERVAALPPHGGAALALVVSDLLTETHFRPLFAAARARRLDLALLQTLAAQERDPAPGDAELIDVETGARLEVGPAEARAYRAALARFVTALREAAAEAGARHVLLPLPAGSGVTAGDAGRERFSDRVAFGELVRHGVLVRR